MSTVATHPATRAIEATLELLADAGIEATRTPGEVLAGDRRAGVLVGLPELVRRTAAARVFTIPVLIVSGDPLSTALAVDRVYSLADEVALALGVAAYRPSSWRSSVNAEPLPALELVATATATESEEP